MATLRRYGVDIIVIHPAALERESEMKFWTRKGAERHGSAVTRGLWKHFGTVARHEVFEDGTTRSLHDFRWLLKGRQYRYYYCNLWCLLTNQRHCNKPARRA